MKPVLLRNIESTTIGEVANPDLVISNAGFAISEDYPFLSTSLDGYVCDPNVLGSCGLVEVKYPYKYHRHTPIEACRKADFFCELVAQSSSDQKFQLKRSHSYYCQVQGQMVITESMV